jgi:hypothetical protein
MQLLRYVFPAAFAVSGLVALSFLPSQKELVSGVSRVETVVNSKASNSKDLFAAKAVEARKYVAQKGFNQELVFLVDMSIPSEKNRFFIYDLKNDEVLASALVSHGMCYGGEPGSDFSNKVGSGCSSLGKYKIGKSYYGQWGYSYKLHGLESSNSNAYERTVVLHAHNSIPDFENGRELVQSLGCPMVSPTFLEELKKIINKSEKAVMLWIYK